MDSHRGLTGMGVALFACTIIVAVSGCAAASAPSPQTASPSADATLRATPRPDTATPVPTESAYGVPPVADGDIAGAVFDDDAGPDGTPVTTLTSYDVVESGVPFVVRGACVGESVGFRVLTAAVGASGETLVEGIIRCDDAEELSYTVMFSGVVQLALTDSDSVTDAWVRASAD